MSRKPQVKPKGITKPPPPPAPPPLPEKNIGNTSLNIEIIEEKDNINPVDKKVLFSINCHAKDIVTAVNALHEISTTICNAAGVKWHHRLLYRIMAVFERLLSKF